MDSCLFFNLYQRLICKALWYHLLIKVSETHKYARVQVQYSKTYVDSREEGRSRGGVEGDACYRGARAGGNTDATSSRRVCRGQGRTRLAPQGRARREPQTDEVASRLKSTSQLLGRGWGGKGAERQAKPCIAARAASAGAALCACGLVCEPFAAEPPPHTS